MDNSRTKKILFALALCAGGVLVNLGGTWLASAAQWPLFFDSIGTILASALGGYLPGILVGLVTNVINGLSDYTSAYYGLISILIAVASAWFSKKNWFKKFPALLLAIAVIALIGGGMGSVLTWFLFGMDFGTGVSAPLAHQIYDSGLRSVFLAQLFADLAIDLGDKAISVLLVALSLRLLPAKIQDAFNFYHWRDEKQDKTPVRVMSLGTKILALIAAAILFISVAVTFITFHQFHDSALENQYAVGESMVRVMASFIDGNRVDDYIAQGERAEGYLETEGHLYAIKSSYPDIEYVYVYRILEDGCHVVFDLDTEDLAGAEPGEVVPFDDAFSEYLPDLLAGKGIAPVISDETFGWLLTFYYPVYNDAGVCQCYAAVDISMPKVIANEQVFMTRALSLFLSFFILLLCSGVFLARHHIVQPVNAMARATQEFAYNTADSRAHSVQHLRSLNIHTGDEIENLYAAFLKTTEETMRYIEEDQAKKEKIAKLQNGLIMVLADVVESRDQCTGDHIRKTAAYARIIMNQMRREGVYAEKLTDAFIEDVVNSAPLHDVGKIHVSDTVLNKPGRLTDEEYATMKHHTTVGAEIIKNAIDAVSNGETGYLREAQNLANYHHERWDGKGYPVGLAGEEIPLSARIMAVADVFDALVSTRSYKKGFSFEKSMDIILEGAGTQFDPQIVAAFSHAEEEVRKTAETHKSRPSG